MNKILISPQKYIQGAGALNNVAEYAKNYGKKSYIIADNFVQGLIKDKIKNSYKNQEGTLYEFGLFNGESSLEEIEKHLKVAKELDVDVIIGIGGGKTLDTAKAVAFKYNKPVIICPTLASTDAPTSALAIIYKPTGEFESYMHLPFNPNIVLLDTELVINAPTRFLVSGMGDALATYYEAKVCVDANSKNMAGGLSTKAAFALATLCKDTLYKYGIEAKNACDNKKINEAFENVVEANTLLSGLGFESSGLAAAHSVHDGLTELEETHHFMHGEKVAFGTIVQAVIDKNYEELEKIVRFNLAVGLPVNLEDLGIVEDVKKKVMIVAEKTVHKDETIHSYPYKMTKEIVYDAIINADEFATNIKKGLK